VSRILVGYDGSDGAKRALDRAVVEARDRHMRTAVVGVASMPLDLDAPRYYGTLDDISPDEGRPLSPPEIVAHLEEAREILAAAGVDAELTSAAGEPGHEIVEVPRRVRSALSSTSLQRRCSVVCTLRAQAKELLGSRRRGQLLGTGCRRRRSV
jgi:nucleotide-binding universal stress UspA family protein